MADGHLAEIFKYIDEHESDYINHLKSWVAIKSVSGSKDPAIRQKTIDMMDLCAKEMKERINAVVRVVANPAGPETGSDGSSIDRPPFICAHLGDDPNKRTVLVYGHLDVQPASFDDGWKYPPFELSEEGDRLYGRGSTDDKGPVLCWMKAIEAYQAKKVEIPVNIKFFFEGMEESGSDGVDDLITQEKEFFSGVDFSCISDNYWLGKEKPCITYGLRGITYFQIKMKCANADLHSGVFGGTVYEGMTDLIHLFSKIVDQKGNILIPGVNELVKPLTDEESALYDDIDFDPADYAKDIGTTKLLQEGENTKKDTLLHRWRYPSLSIHGFQGAFAEAGMKTVIPGEITGKFSMRLVPYQDPQPVQVLVKNFLTKLHAESGSPNIMTIEHDQGGKPWLSDFDGPNYQAGEKAVFRVFGVKPDFTREGGSIPVVLSIQNATGTSLMMLPIGQSDDGAHSQNEKINKTNYVNGVKILSAYFHELAQLP